MSEVSATYSRQTGGIPAKLMAKHTLKATIISLCQKFEASLKPHYTIPTTSNIYNQYRKMRKLKDNLEKTPPWFILTSSRITDASILSRFRVSTSVDPTSKHHYTPECILLQIVPIPYQILQDMIHHLGFGHLSPVLQDIKEQYPAVTTLHFI